VRRPGVEAGSDKPVDEDRQRLGRRWRVGLSGIAREDTPLGTEPPGEPCEGSRVVTAQQLVRRDLGDRTERAQLLDLVAVQPGHVKRRVGEQDAPNTGGARPAHEPATLRRTEVTRREHGVSVGDEPEDVVDRTLVAPVDRWDCDAAVHRPAARHRQPVLVVGPRVQRGHPDDAATERQRRRYSRRVDTADGVVENDAAEDGDPGARPCCGGAPGCRLAMPLEHAAAESGLDEHAHGVAVVCKPGQDAWCRVDMEIEDTNGPPGRRGYSVGRRMLRRPVSFFSARRRLDGDLYLPADAPADARFPAVIACSGYTGLKDIHPARFARALVPQGYACLAFDYRGFGASEGERGRLVPQEQVEDVRAAVSFLTSVPEIAGDRIGLLGWALGGGVAIAEAADDVRVRAVVACNPIGDGERSTRAMHTAESWSLLLERIAGDRDRRVLDGVSELVSPFEIVVLDEVTRPYVETELYRTAGYGAAVSLESGEHLLRFRPEEVVARIAPRPLLLVHGEDNRLHLPEESLELHRRAGEPKELVLLEGTGHTEWMHDTDPTFVEVAALIRRFLDEHLR
jgi:uncharacterized protein